MARAKKAPTKARPTDELLGDAREAVRAGRFGEALAALLAAWQGKPATAIADAIDVVGARAMEGLAVPMTAAWEKAARSGDPAMRGVLLATVAETKGHAETRARIELLVTWRDPRVATRIVELIERAPFSVHRARTLWTRLWELVPRLGDARVLARLARLDKSWRANRELSAATRERLRHGLARCEPLAREAYGEPPELTPIEAAVCVGVVFEAKPSARSVARADTIDELRRAVYAAPDDDAPRLVLADALQQRGDPRGELIALQLASAGGAAVAARRTELFAALAPWSAWIPMENPVLTAHWGIGFVERLRVFVRTTKRHLREVFEHDSLRLLTELEVTVEYGGELAGVAAPAALRRLAMSGQDPQDAPLWRTLPRLERLELGQTYGELSHPHLASLHLQDFAIDALETLAAPQLPSLVELALDATSVHVAGAPVCEHLARSGLLAQLAVLDLQLRELRDADVELLARELGGRKLARLAVSAERLPLRARPRLEALADELVLEGGEAAPPAAGYVEHVNKPEWGRGRIVRAFDGKLEIAFASGTRVIKADAPFLRVVG